MTGRDKVNIKAIVSFYQDNDSSKATPDYAQMLLETHPTRVIKAAMRQKYGSSATLIHAPKSAQEILSQYSAYIADFLILSFLITTLYALRPSAERLMDSFQEQGWHMEGAVETAVGITLLLLIVLQQIYFSRQEDVELSPSTNNNEKLGAKKKVSGRPTKGIDGASEKHAAEWETPENSRTESTAQYSSSSSSEDEKEIISKKGANIDKNTSQRAKEIAERLVARSSQKWKPTTIPTPTILAPEIVPPPSPPPPPLSLPPSVPPKSPSYEIQKEAGLLVPVLAPQNKEEMPDAATFDPFLPDEKPGLNDNISSFDPFSPEEKGAEAPKSSTPRGISGSVESVASPRSRAEVEAGLRQRKNKPSRAERGKGKSGW
jgi:hypothetical protein